MEKKRAIPQGYMTVGEVSKKMGVTVRTMQYYDKQGLLSPSAESEGGRRLYTNKDLVKLHQILSLKSLGFSLDDIKGRLIALDTPQQVAGALSEQAAEIRSKIDSLSESLREIELLKAEVLQMQTVDFKKYADIIVNLQMENEFYWLIKHFDSGMMDHIRSRFDKETGLSFIDNFSRLSDEVIKLKEADISPESDKAQRLTKEYWDMITDFTGGDLTILNKLEEMVSIEKLGNDWGEKQALVNAYIEPALGIYFENLGADPFEEEVK